MGILCDRHIREVCDQEAAPVIAPFSGDQLQPSSYDVRLGRTFQIIDRAREEAVDLSDARSFDGLYTRLEVPSDGFYLLPAKSFVLACTHEKLHMPVDLVARIESKSKIARAGLIIETAGYVDPGFRGVLTMELYNQLERAPIILRPGLLIAQLSFEGLTGTPDRVYGECGNHFQDDDEAVGFRLRTDRQARGVLHGSGDER